MDGQGGTGTSFLIRALSSGLQQLCPGTYSVVAMAALTDVTANTIGGITLPSMLRLPVSKTLTKLSSLIPSEISNLQAKLRAIKYFIIHEKSMIGMRIMSYIDAPESSFRSDRTTFSVAATSSSWATFYQLPPVMEEALYSTQQSRSPCDIKG